MKEHNYTIPLTEAIESRDGCVLCKIEKDLTERALEYYMGAAVMEPSVRIETNAKGFCRLHGEAMLAMPKKLPLILALQTRLDTMEKQLQKAKKPGKKREKTCAVCERVAGQMENCMENCLWLLRKEPDFLEKFEFFTGVPDSQLKPLCNYLMATKGISKQHIIAVTVRNRNRLIPF